MASRTRIPKIPAFRNFQASETVVVRIKFDGSVARTVCETRWHASQMVLSRCKDTAEISFDLAVTPELVNWIKSFGQNARVIEPKLLEATLENSNEALHTDRAL